jgi:hypothetical protein
VGVEVERLGADTVRLDVEGGATDLGVERTEGALLGAERLGI